MTTLIRFLFVVALLFTIVYGFDRLKDAPGEVTLPIGDAVYVLSPAIAVLAFLAAVLALALAILLLAALFRAPSRIARFWRRRREAQSRLSIEQGLIAAAAGDLRTAERAASDAGRRAGDAPLGLLLRAQTAQLKGDRTAARQAFAAMLEKPETRVVGLRGLHAEAEHEGEHDAARLYAEEARRLAPSAPWAGRALLRRQTAEGDWEGALRTLSTYADSRVIDRKTARRQRAVVLTAQAMALESGEPERARAAALEAHELAPDLVPAAVVAGRVLTRLGDIKRAAKVLEETWRLEQHPDIAEAYAHVRPGDSARDRLARVEYLMRMRSQADAGRLALARAAMAARDWEKARDALKPVLTTRPTRSALLLMAEIEEGEHGDSARARNWMTRALHAPRDPVWIADGVVLEEWAPVSPVTGRLDAVEWKVPAEQLQGPVFEPVGEEDFQPLALMSATPAEAEMHPTSEAVDLPPSYGDVHAEARDAATPPASFDTPSPAATVAEPVAPAAAHPPFAETTTSRGNGADAPDSAVSHLPDDPGVPPPPEEERSRFRLF